MPASRKKSENFERIGAAETNVTERIPSTGKAIVVQSDANRVKNSKVPAFCSVFSRKGTCVSGKNRVFLLSVVFFSGILINIGRNSRAKEEISR